LKVATITIQKDTGWTGRGVEFVITVGDHDVILGEAELRLALHEYGKADVKAFIAAARAEWRTGLKEKKG
jgi:hypothetical protein